MREDWWLVTITGLKARELGCRRRVWVDGELSPEQLLRPGTGKRGDEASYVLPHQLVGLFIMTVGFWMEGGRQAVGGADEATECTPKFGQELGTRSETTSKRNPCRRTACCKKSSAVCLAVGSPGRATRWTALENLSTNVVMVVMPLASGRQVMKSIPT